MLLLLLLLCTLFVLLAVFELGNKYPRLLMLLGVVVLFINVCNVVIFDLAALALQAAVEDGVDCRIVWTFLLSYSICDGGSCWIAADCMLVLLLLGVLVLLLKGYEILLGLL